MATYTNNFALVKPTYGELADVAVINGNMDTIDGIMHSNRTMLAPAFSQTEDYAEGDVVVYEGNLYRFIVPHTAGNWDGTEVEQTTLGEEVSTKGGADVTKTASGNPITFDDGADAPLVKCVTEIQGSQDLHGYDKPWVGGSGKNKLEVTGSSTTVSGVTFTVNNDGTILVNGTATADIQYNVISNWSAFPAGNYILNGCPSGLSNMNLYVNPDRTQAYYDNGSGVSFSVTSEIIVRIYMATGVTANNVLFKPMIRLANETDPTFAPYSNLCPITAYMEGSVNVVKIRIDVGTITVNQGGLSSSNGYAYDANNRCFTDSIPIDDNTSYYVQYDNGDNIKVSAIHYYRTKNYDSWISRDVILNTFTTPTGCNYIRLVFVRGDDASLSPTNISMTKIFLSVGSPTTHTTTYPSAIYRGSEDCVKGTVTTEWGMIASYAGETLPGEWISDRDEYAPGTTPTTGAQVAYALATPTTSSVTPTNLPIKSLSGYNHIESSTGDMEIEYITEEFQPLVDLIEESKAESGHVYSTTPTVIGKWIDQSDIYEYVKTINTTIPASGSATDVALSEIPSTANILKIHAVNVNIGWGDGGGVQSVPCWAMQTNTYPNVSIAQFSPWSFYATHLIIQYIESTPTRSLNLTKSAVTEEIPDEIKNAPFEEKPETNEADDDAPTEVDER